VILSIKMAEVTVVSSVQILKNYSFSENSSSNEEYESLQEKKYVKHSRIENYAQTVVLRYKEYEFKSYFRLNITFFTLLISFLNIFNYGSTNKYIINVFILLLV